MTDIDEPDRESDFVDDDFGSPIDLGVAITGLLVHGETRDSIARQLQITRAEVDEQIAAVTGVRESEPLNEREWVIWEKLRDLTRQASDVALASYDTPRLSLLLEIAKLELGLIGWERRRQGLN